MKMFDNKIEQKHDDNLFMKILIEKKLIIKTTIKRVYQNLFENFKLKA